MRAVQLASLLRAAVPTRRPASLAQRRHRRKKLNRTSAHRIAMLRNMVTSLIKHERIRTTTPKAKTLRPYAERLVTYAKKSDQRHGMNLAARIVREQGALRKPFEVIGPRYADAQRRIHARAALDAAAARRRGADVRYRMAWIGTGRTSACPNRRGDHACNVVVEEARGYRAPHRDA